jgi:DNA-binding LacI/PurR family transcriptional regulator
MKKRPTALVTANDQIAIGAIHTLRAAGVSIPRELSVTGFDNLDLGRKLHPTLTTIDQNSTQITERAGRLLIEQIKLPAEERGKPIAEMVAPELVIGESTGPAWIK